MNRYQANCAQLGWLLLPHKRAVATWQGGQQGMAQRLDTASRLEAGEAFGELVLDLEAI